MSTPAPAATDQFEIGGKVFNSRLIIGTGKYRSFEEMKAAHRASGAEMVTVAVRRVPLDRSSESFLDHLDSSLQILPNTAGCYSAEEALRTARLAREAWKRSGLSWKSSAIRRRCSRTMSRHSKPRARWSKKALSSCPTSPTI